MTFNSDDLANFDNCPRLMVWSKDWKTPRLTVAAAMYAALHEGLISGKPKAAKDKVMHLAADPGLNIYVPNLYESVQHHASLMEIITEYLLADGPKWTQATSVEVGGHVYHPTSYVLPDGRLRRVVLCSSWDELRQKEETSSWRVIGDVIATNRPMLINSIIIGSSNKGFRPSAWTRGYLHPIAKHLRITKRDGTDDFVKSWKAIYRERFDRGTKEWLTQMQNDRSFDEVVKSTLVDVPVRAREFYSQMVSMLDEMSTLGESPAMRRSACFKLIPCQFSPICHHSEPINPGDANWLPKSNPKEKG